ncbi:hypothetical protein AKN88_02880 [Thiopseudomonas alkaliphila]|uniref:YecA family protein n=1 Tax=Thiopseudomonas alkaliphila TaxID=1697053 RepID=A0A0K1XCL0_9GAMM|nr:YecA family protein [Thiopseudomonas alkaliphila]AKX58999.1 hypothetical protein AKN88_02880 [Thiopseudomonas alkaliphila]
MSFSEQLNQLQVFLDADDLHDEALDFMASNGYLTALCISPVKMPQREWIDELFAEEPAYQDANEKAQIEDALVQLKNQIARQLASDDDIELPCELYLGDDPDLSDLRSWCIGFMEGVFMEEQAWFAKSEDEVSELLLPIMVASGLFDDEPEFADFLKDDELVDSMIEQIPEILTALFLLFNAPDEKPALLKR